MSKQFFKDKETGMNIAQAEIPEGYQTAGRIVDRWQHDLVPFMTSAQAFDSEKKVILYSSGRQMYEEYTNPMAKNLVTKDPNNIQSGFRDYIDPQLFLEQFASGLVNAPVRAMAVAKLPSFYGAHLDEYRNQFREYFQSHKIDINVRLEMAGDYTDAILMKFATKVDGHDAFVLAGCDYRGMEIYDANNMAAMYGGFGLLGGGLFGKKNLHTASPFSQGSQRVDTILWGAERMYACIYTPEKETEATSAFVKFVQSYVPDEALMRQFYTLIEQRYQNNYMRAMQLAGMAQQMQMQAMRFQQQTAMNISRQMSSISDGIMDSWNQKMASDARISQNYSEAIRGVNTYVDNNGKTFEFSNQADHVYTNQYGDHIGVSGAAVDPSLASRLNWTEVNKK